MGGEFWTTMVINLNSKKKAPCEFWGHMDMNSGGDHLKKTWVMNSDDPTINHSKTTVIEFNTQVYYKSKKKQ